MKVISLALLLTLIISSTAVADPVIGDGKYSTTQQKQGYIFSCTSKFGGAGAFRDGEWINQDGTWSPEKKIAVQGSVAWPEASFTTSMKGNKLLLSGNGLPVGHNTGIFPIASTDPAYNYDRNPGRISAQTVKYSLSNSPKREKKPSCLSMGPIGVMNSGVLLFNGLDGQGKDAPAHEIQDSCQGHPERSGSYHYHSLSSCIKDGSAGHSKRLGWALDGFGIYGKRGSDGRIVTNADLDICHGHSHKVLWRGKKQKIYHYHMTEEYPYSLGCFRGKPIKTSTNNTAPNDGPPNGGPPNGGPPNGGPPAP